MADITNFPAFLLATLALCAIPGPDFIYIVGRSVAQGRRAALVSAAGVNLGAACHVLAAALGLSAFLAASAEAFFVLKYVGAAYLVFLGVRNIRRGSVAPAPSQGAPGPARRDHGLLLQGVLTDLLNPKVALFFLAFLPQFIAPSAERPLGAFLFLGGIVLVVGFACDVSLVLCSDRITRGLRRNPGFERLAGRLLGCALVGLGVRLACEDR